MPQPLPAPPSTAAITTLEDARIAIEALTAYMDSLRQQLSNPPRVAAIADEAGTADTTYSQNEVDMLNSIKTKLNSMLAALRGTATIAE